MLKTKFIKAVTIFNIICLPVIVLSFTLNDDDRPDTTLSPTTALIKSAIIPGWGQCYVGKPLKGLLYLAAEGYHLYRMIQYHQIVLKEKQGYNIQISPRRALEKRNKYAWWCAGIYIMGMLDAYVDAHLINFPEDKIELSGFIASRQWGLSLSIKLRSSYAD